MSVNFKHIEELERLIKKHNLSHEDICLISGTALAVFGVRMNGDVDICLHPQARRQLMGGNGVDGKVARVFPTGDVHLTTNVEIPANPYLKVPGLGISDERLLSDNRFHEVVDGYKVARIELEYVKRIWRARTRGLLKDAIDAKLIEQYARKEPQWDWDLVPKEYRGPHNSLYFMVQFRHRVIQAKKHLSEIRGWVLGRALPLLHKRKTRNREFSAILWPPVEPWFDDIERELVDRGIVVGSEDFMLSEQGFERFVLDIYRRGTTPDEKIRHKIDAMKIYPKKVRCLRLILEKPRFKFIYSGVVRSMETEKIKRELRQKYAPKIKQYTNDIIIHIGDNWLDNERHINIINKLENNDFALERDDMINVEK